MFDLMVRKEDSNRMSKRLILLRARVGESASYPQWYPHVQIARLQPGRTHKSVPQVYLREQFLLPP